MVMPGLQEASQESDPKGELKVWICLKWKDINKHEIYGMIPHLSQMLFFHIYEYLYAIPNIYLSLKTEFYILIFHQRY